MANHMPTPLHAPKNPADVSGSVARVKFESLRKFIATIASYSAKYEP